jgi:hypothetical protein
MAPARHLCCDVSRPMNPPLLPPDDLRAALRAALDDRSRALLRRPPPRGDATIASGAAGLALAHAALDRALPGRGHFEAAGRCLERAVGALASTPMPPAAIDGYVGVLWAGARLAPDDIAPACARADASLRASLRRRGPDAHDLFQGAAGVLRYALDRADGAPRVARAALDQIERSLRRGPAGASWRSTVMLPRRRVVRRLGLAHGAAGVLTALAACAARGVERARAEALADEVVGWVRAVAASRGDGPLPDAVADTGDLDGRAAYCIGGVGAALGVLRAGEAFQRDDWRAEGLALGRAAAAWTAGDAAVVDGGVCHGAAGLGLVFHRLAQGSDDPAPFTAARDRWLRALLATRAAPDPALLTGAAGIALVIATVLGADDGWDAPLGTDLLPRAISTGSDGIHLAKLAPTR